jgi:hypothetical protein
MKIEPDDLRRWGHDELTKTIDQHVSSMPDRPPVVVAVIVWGHESDQANAEALRPLAPQYFSTQALLWLDRPVRIIYLGFDASDSSALHSFWSVAAAMPRVDEMALYINGKAEFRVDRLIHGPPPTDSVFAAYRPSEQP